MRRLPVFFVLDCSESMVGENLKNMENGLKAIIQSLRADPHALETVYISFIAFAGIAKTIVPLIEVVSFYPPKLPLGGGTNLGIALETLMIEIDNSVIKTTADRKGDWKPIIYLFTDGHPTDNPDEAINRWNSKYANKSTLIAIGLGKTVDFSVLTRLTEHVISYEQAQEGDFTKFVKWVTASLLAQSQSVGEGKDSNALPILDETVMRLVKNSSVLKNDESCVTLIGRCQKTRKPYIMKYDRLDQNLASTEFKIKLSNYHISGCYPLEEDYFNWSDPRTNDSVVNTSELIGNRPCPHCGGISSFAVCGCGKLMCINELGSAICPWCEKQVYFGDNDDGGDIDFAVGRSRG